MWNDCVPESISCQSVRIHLYKLFTCPAQWAEPVMRGFILTASNLPASSVRVRGSISHRSPQRRWDKVLVGDSGLPWSSGAVTHGLVSRLLAGPATSNRTFT